MKDVIYVPLGETKGLRQERMKLVQKFVDDGWTMDGKVMLEDAFGLKVDVIVLVKAEGK